MRVLSIQSHVAYGHVGNSAAVFPLQRLGHEVWPVLTVNFSNHTGYGAWRGPLIAAEDVAAVITGIGERGAFESCDAILSGYQGSPEIADVIADAVAQVVRGRFLYSGGIGTLDDLRGLVELRQVNLGGVIVGKALYEKRFTIAEAHAVLDGK